MVNNEFGSITLACVPTAATHLIPEVLPQFIDIYPGVDLRLLDDNSRSIERMVLAEEADFGICSHFVEDGRLTADLIMEDEYGLVVNATHPLARRRSLRWNEVMTLPLLGSAAHQQLAYYADAPSLPTPHVFISNMISLLSLLERGMGAAVLARLAIPPHYEGQLRFVPIVAPRIQRKLVLLKLAKRSLSVPARHLVDLIRARANSLRSK
ncbi:MULTISPECIES: LysR substrate-binding domain-containing protein [unclassified Achromobacter]|uniref:LysR substrate-binding domain-containing protein n=1 Tax=unclassified Achromobacter TaxID=2626865 RepID=UPI0013033FC2|nr:MULTISPECIES: LysR substrate-binding domain-containing protein [unclassified Achromobacter]